MCGTTRKREDILSMKYDIYVRDKTSQSLIRVGLCRACFITENVNLVKVKENIESSEKQCRDEHGKPHPENCKFQKAELIGWKKKDQYWQDFKSKHPKGSKKQKDFLEVVDAH